LCFLCFLVVFKVFVVLFGFLCYENQKHVYIHIFVIVSRRPLQFPIQAYFLFDITSIRYLPRQPGHIHELMLEEVLFKLSSH
jgi:hypothetical protein